MRPYRLTLNHILATLPACLRLVGFGLLCLTLGCASAADRKAQKNASGYVPPGQTNRRILELRLEGVTAVDEEELREGLASQEDPGWRANGFVSRLPVLGADANYFNELAWQRDRERIINYYNAHGYFDATIVSDRVSEVEDPYGIKILARIEEGEPTRVSSIILDGLESTDIDRASLLKDLELREGEIFTEEKYKSAKDAVERIFKRRSYAYAKVKGRAIVDPQTKQARVFLFTDPGPKTIFGEVTIQGLDRVAESYVRDAVVIQDGKLFSSQDLQETQENIYDLGVFSLVTVQPEFEYDRNETQDKIAKREQERSETTEPSEVGAMGISDLLGQAQDDAAKRSALPTRVKILIKVKEAKNWSVRVGAGFSINSNRQDVHVALNLQSRNFANILGKLEQFNTVGYALTPGIFSINTADGDLTLDDFGYRGIYFNSLLRYTQPQFLERKTTGFLLANVERDIQESYIALIPSASIGLRRQLYLRKLTGEVSYNTLFIYYQAFDAQYGEELRAQGLNPNASNPSLLLEYLEQKIIYDGRDSPLNPTSGVRAQVSMQEARRYIVGGEYAFLKPRVQVDGYLPVGKRFVTAARAGAGSIYNTNKPEDNGETKGIPLLSRLYGGGKGSVRSFGPRYFGFFTDDVVNPTPIGSITLVEAGIEQRMRLKRNLLDVGDLWGALYLDSGTFFEQQLFADTNANDAGTVGFKELSGSFIHGLGLGTYWLTPIGPVRADFAYTLNNIRRDFRFAGDPTVVDDPDTPRNELYSEYQYRAAVREKVRRFDFYLGIGHSF